MDVTAIKRGYVNMQGLLFNLNGINGQLEVYDNRIIIKRKGVLSKLAQGFFKGDKEILISKISAIQVKLGTTLTNGYIQFTLSGANENTKGILSATTDENTVMFDKKHNDEVIKIKECIYTLIDKDANPNNFITNDSIADELIKLKKLLDEGILSEEEFQVEKNKILNK